jgi:hypothetical protein
MKKGLIFLLKLVLLIIAIGALTFMIGFPQTEGRAANLDLISIYTDPFIIYIYIASIPFFVGLYYAFKLLGYFDKNKIFSSISVNAVRNIKYCAMIVIGFILGAEAFLLLVERSKSDDMAGGVAMGIFIIVISVLIAASAAIFEIGTKHVGSGGSHNDESDTLVLTGKKNK